MFSSLPRMAPKYRRHVGEFGTVKCADIDAFDQRVSTFLACKFAVDGEFQTCAMHLTTRVLLPYDRTIPQGYGLGRPEHRRSSRAPQYESAAFFFPRLRWGTERFMAGRAGLSARRVPVPMSGRPTCTVCHPLLVEVVAGSYLSHRSHHG